MSIELILIVAGTTLGFLLLFGLLLAKFYQAVEPGFALVINTTKDVRVSFSGATVMPIIHRAELMDIRLQTLVVERRGAQGMVCRDNIRADVKMVFHVVVNRTQEDVLKVAQSIGCARASNKGVLHELFIAKFTEAMKSVFKRVEFMDALEQRDDVKDQIIRVVGRDLGGYRLDDVAIAELDMTPTDALDPANILDAEGIRKITERTAEQARLRREVSAGHERDMVRLEADSKEQLSELRTKITAADKELARLNFGQDLSS